MLTATSKLKAGLYKTMARRADGTIDNFVTEKVRGEWWVMKQVPTAMGIYSYGYVPGFFMHSYTAKSLKEALAWIAQG